MNRVLPFLVPILLAGIAYAGWAGVKARDTVVVESCRESYQRHLVTPFIRNWWECRRQTPCGVDDRFAKHNATVRVIQCLCATPDDTSAEITALYQDLPLTVPAATTLDQMCANAVEQGRL